MPEANERLKLALADRYAIQCEIGAGGMATVYLAEDRKHHRLVAVKVLRPELTAVVGSERFLQEIQVTAGLQHPSIVPLYDSGEADGFLYYVMPFIDGESLRSCLDREKQLGVAKAIRIASSVAAALQYAHEQGIVHRDIKPENVLVQKGQALVTDFGIALAIRAASDGTRLTETGLALGTPHYMSPEQAAGDREVDARSDVHALGALVYEMLIGDPPFPGSTAQSVIARVLTARASGLGSIRPDVSPYVDRAVQRALAKVPADRFDSAAAFAAALETGEADREIRTPPVAVASGPWGLRRSRLVAAGALTLGLVALAFAVGRGFVRIGGFASTPTGLVARGALPKSIAVLPFRDMSSGGDHAWFGEGLAEEILSALARIPHLRVVARTSSFSIGNLPIAVVGDSLKVATVLEGSVRREGDRIRIHAQLVDAAEESLLWSRTFEDELTSVLDVQETIARAVVNALELELAAGPVPLMAAGSTSPVSHEQYLRGRYRWNQRTEAGVLAAIGHFRRAVEIDSTYAAAWAGLADSYLVLPEYSATVDPDLVRRESEIAASRAIALDPGRPEALTSMAWSRLIHRYDWSGAETGLRQALAVDSTNVNALHWISHVLSWRGRHHEALRWATRAVEVDPLSPLMHANLAFILMEAGEYDPAIDRAQRSLALDPDFHTSNHTLWDTYLRAGRFEDAAAALQRWAKGTARDPDAAEQLAALIERHGRTGEPLTLPPDLSGRMALGSQWLGQVYAAVGDRTSTLAALERAYLERSGSRSLLSLKVNPVYDFVRDDPRFVALLRRMGLDN